MQASLSARKDRESSSHHCGSPVKLMQACLSTMQVYTRKQLSPLWKSCNARTSLFLFVKGLTKRF